MEVMSPAWAGSHPGPAMQNESDSTSTFADAGAEPVDVVRIRLVRRAGATVVVSEFRAANRVLADWAAQACSDCQVDFEVTFFDGLRLRGCHPLLRRGKCDASLSRAVRRLVKGMAQDRGTARYLVDG
jgi:hypothetical protein